MLLILAALCLFLFAGNTGKIVRQMLTIFVCNVIVYFGIPIFAVMLYYWKASV